MERPHKTTTATILKRLDFSCY